MRKFLVTRILMAGGKHGNRPAQVRPPAREYSPKCILCGNPLDDLRETSRGICRRCQEKGANRG